MSNQKSKRKRQEQFIIERLNLCEDVLSTIEVARTLNISESTARRLFNELEEKGSVVRVYGGIVNSDNNLNEYRFDKLQMQYVEEKQRIGKAASQLINDGDTLFIDSGTTAQQVAIGMARRLRRKELNNIRVFTNSMINVEILSDYCEVSLLGGMYRKNRKDFYGYITDIVLDVISFDKSFVGADSIYVGADGGASASDTYTAQISRKVVGKTAENYVVADCTKFNKRSLVEFINMKQMNTIITDVGLSDEVVNEGVSQGVKILRV